MSTITIEVLLGILAFSGTSLLAFVIFRRDTTSWTHRLFLLLAIFIDIYIVINFLSLHPPLATPGNQLFWIRMVMFITSFIGPTLVLLVHTFPNRQITLSARYFIMLGGLLVASTIASISPLVFKAIEYPAGEPVPVPGPGIVIFLLDFIGLFIVSFIILIIKYVRAQGIERIKQRYLLVGVLASFSLMGLSTVLFVVILKTSAFVFLGPIFPVILVAAIAFAIVKHQLFNIQVLVTQVLVTIIWIFLFARIFISRDITERTIDIVIFLTTLFIGTFIVRSVRKEVTSRDEIERLAEDLAHANTRLRELDQLKSEFLSLASHQLRSPITSIKGYTSLILEGSFGRVPKKIREALDKVFSSSNSMAMVVDDFLNISRIEQGRLKYDFKPIPLRELLEEVIDEQKPIVAEAGLTLHAKFDIAESFTINADRDKFRQVFENLIDNAVKYTPKGSISVELERQGEKVRIAIRDTGAGIAPEVLPTLFTKFRRAPNALRMNVSGSGLGLYIAKEIVKAHHGKIWAESEGEGKGSTFLIELPLV